jgi:hypothetical protein
MVRAMVPCSEEHELALLEAARRAAAGGDVAVVPVYTPTAT